MVISKSIEGVVTSLEIDALGFAVFFLGKTRWWGGGDIIVIDKRQVNHPFT